MKPITTSLFELFKIGPGPSSSHTIGPMKAGYDFINTVRALPPDVLARAESIKVHLYGSLSATGRGHGTDRAVLAGLLGENPRTCSSEFMDDLDRENPREYEVRLGTKTCRLTWDDIVFDAVDRDLSFSNTLVIRLLGENSIPLFEREYYSVGGGFIQWKGQKEQVRGLPVYPYATMEGLKKILRTQKLRLHEVILANEQALTGASEEEILQGLDAIISTMEGPWKRESDPRVFFPVPSGSTARHGFCTSGPAK
jgi:L-serine dehydratase